MAIEEWEAIEMKKRTECRPARPVSSMFEAVAASMLRQGGLAQALVEQYVTPGPAYVEV